MYKYQNYSLKMDKSGYWVARAWNNLNGEVYYSPWRTSAIAWLIQKGAGHIETGAILDKTA